MPSGPRVTTQEAEEPNNRPSNPTESRQPAAFLRSCSQASQSQGSREVKGWREQKERGGLGPADLGLPAPPSPQGGGVCVCVPVRAAGRCLDPSPLPWA